MKIPSLPSFKNPFSKPPAPKSKGGKKDSARGAPKENKPKAKGPSAAHHHPLPDSEPLFQLSDERRIDVIGILLALAGVLILIFLPSPPQQPGLLAVLFGEGGYALAAALILIGMWLVFRKIEQIPNPSIERATGVILLAVGAQTALHGLRDNPGLSSGQGGGWLGGLLYGLLADAFGTVGAAIILLAWLLIAVTLTFDLTIPELIARLTPLWNLIRKTWQALRLRLDSQAKPANHNHPDPSSDGYTPLQPAPTHPEAELSAPVMPGLPVSASAAPRIAWSLPNIKDILSPGSEKSENEAYIKQCARVIEETLASFGAPAQVVEINSGPTVTQFGVEPLFIESRNGRTRVRVSKIVSLSDDLALALAAPRIRIQAPVPGRSYLGIEVPNEEISVVALRDILESESFLRRRKALSFALGRDVSGLPIGADLGAMPHLLIAGATGSGKSVCVNSILTCLLLNNTPEDLRLVLVDPKRVELTGYNGIPHLLAPVVVEMERVVGALQWMTREMDRRYHMFAQAGARNITDYNAQAKAKGQKLPFIIVIIDELADLMMLAPDETERTITRLAQLARATGIHLILATQRPSVDVVTGLIKANFPARIAFAVASNTDSRVILDQPGAERLLGRGDMLYQAPESPAPARLQGVFVSDGEIHRLVEFWRGQNTQAAPPPGGAIDAPAPHLPLKQTSMFPEDITALPESGDPLYKEALDLIRREGRASVSMLQRRLRIGYTRAARLIDQLEEKGLIGKPEDNTGVRPVLDYGPNGPPNDA